MLERIVIDQDHQIISGHRRLEAIKSLGWKTVECEQISLPSEEVLVRLIHHNKQRIKTCREQINEVKVLMDQYRVGQGKRNDLSTCEKIYTGSKSRDVVGKLVGMSGVQVFKLLFIEKENIKLIDLIDDGILTINQAYIQLNREKKERESRSSIKPNFCVTSMNDSIDWLRSLVRLSYLLQVIQTNCGVIARSNTKISCGY